MAGKKQSTFQLVIGAVDQLSGPFGSMQRSMAALGRSCEQLKGRFAKLSSASGLNILAGAVGNVRARMRNVMDESRRLASGVASTVGKLSMAFGAAGGGAFALAKATANAGDKAAKSAARAGVGVKVWQEYAHAANLSAVSEEQLEKSFVRLQSTALKAAGGDKASLDALRLAGIDPRDANGKVKAAEQLFLELSDSIKKLQDSGQAGQATNLLTAVFGKSGAALMPMLKGGSQGLLEMRAEAHKLGLVFGEDAASIGENFNDALTRAGGALKGVGFTIGQELLPPLTKLLEKFTAWVAESRGLIGTGFAEWVKSIDIDALWQKIQSGLESLGKLRQFVADIVDGLGGWENVAKGLVALLGLKLAGSVASLATSIGTLGTAILTTPVGWLLAAAAAIYAIYKNWAKLKEFAGNAWEKTKAFFKGGSDEDAEDAFDENAGSIDLSGAQPAQGAFAAPQNLGARAAPVVQATKTETIERNLVEIRVKAEDGAQVQAALSGQSAGEAVSLDDGQLMQGAW